MTLPFTASPGMTLGVELELQLLDPETRDLTPAAPLIFAHPAVPAAAKPEIFRSMLEIATGVCTDVAEVRLELAAALRGLQEVCRDLGVAVAGGGAHPFARYRDRVASPGERFSGVLEREQWIARRLAVCGLHVHLGMRDGDHAMAMMNAILPYAPHLLALAASSPFWEGADTGLAAARVTVFESMPTAGVPQTFATWAEFEQAYEGLVSTGSIRSVKDLWWDVRPHPDFGTLELRICDTPPTLSEVVAVVALIQSLAAWLDRRLEAGGAPQRPPALWLRQNKWRAARHGIAAEIVLEDGRSVAPLRREIEKLLRTVEPCARPLGAAEELAGVRRILAVGPGYVRQRAAYAEARSLRDVADLLVAELDTDVPGGLQDLRQQGA